MTTISSPILKKYIGNLLQSSSILQGKIKGGHICAP